LKLSYEAPFLRHFTARLEPGGSAHSLTARGSHGRPRSSSPHLARDATMT
jgi:hypothetical protein